MVFANTLAKGNERLVVVHLGPDCVYNIENTVGICVGKSSLAVLCVGYFAKLWFKVLVRSYANVEPCPPIISWVWRHRKVVNMAENGDEGFQVIVLQLYYILFAFLIQKVNEKSTTSLSRGTYRKKATRATQLAEVRVCSANNGLVHADLGAITELDGQV